MSDKYLRQMSNKELYEAYVTAAKNLKIYGANQILGFMTVDAEVIRRRKESDLLAKADALLEYVADNKDLSGGEAILFWG